MTNRTEEQKRGPVGRVFARTPDAILRHRGWVLDPETKERVYQLGTADTGQPVIVHCATSTVWGAPWIRLVATAQDEGLPGGGPGQVLLEGLGEPG